jgi:hypothetical protein
MRGRMGGFEWSLVALTVVLVVAAVIYGAVIMR